MEPETGRVADAASEGATDSSRFGPKSPGRILRSKTGRVVLFGALAGGLAVGGAGIAAAATGTQSPSSGSSSGSSNSSSGSTTTPPPPGGRGLWHGAGRLGIPGGLLHGQFVASKPGGGYQTLDVQRGTASAISSGSITVRSQDGYSHTYSVNAQTRVDAQRDGISSISNNDELMVVAVNNNGADTAQSIADLTKLRPPNQAPGSQNGNSSPNGNTSQSGASQSGDLQGPAGGPFGRSGGFDTASA